MSSWDGDVKDEGGIVIVAVFYFLLYVGGLSNFDCQFRSVQKGILSNFCISLGMLKTFLFLKHEQLLLEAVINM